MLSIEDFTLPILQLIAPSEPPGSSLFIILVGILVSVISTLVSRRFIDVKKLKSYTKIVKDFQGLRMKAMRTQDRRLLKQVDDEQKTFERVQKELLSMRLKPMMITFIPLILVFISMNSYYGGTGDGDVQAIVGNIPFSLPEQILFRFGHDCESIRGNIQEQYGSQLTTEQYNNNLTKWDRLCWNNEELHYVPSYIGWYLATNITIGVVIQKFAGLSPD